MQSSLISVVLCISAQASFACQPASDNAPEAVATINAHVIQAQASGPELITTAAAGTRDGALPAKRSAPRAEAQADPEHPRRAGPAMLLAALALMFGIALRRYSAGSR